MPAKDRFHPHVVDALIRDGWTVTHDPLAIRVGRKIAVEVKSFLGASEIHDLEVALGQFVLYSEALADTDPDRVLYIAVRLKTYEELFEEPLGSRLVSRGRLRLLVFDPDRREVLRWIP